MPLPDPPIALVDACSTIYDNTLYTYSASAFQSLPLVQGAQWSQLPMKQSVSGGACVLATPADDKSQAALYIVGGITNSTTDNYQGLQRYVFSEKRWESLTPTAAVTQNRLNHSAVYLNASSSILVYAGSQDGSTQLSSQTFTISTIDPYTVIAYESIAPPGISPLLLPWSESEAVMIGGSDTNRQVILFSPDKAWVNSSITLANPLKDQKVEKAVVIEGDDGSKSLFTFDVTISPNQVNRTILVDANGNPVANAQPISSRSIPDSLGRNSLGDTAEILKRENLTLANWPAYNASLAPTTTRDEYSIAVGQSGLVVICGGNADDVLCMFDARDNCWINATAVLEKSSSIQSAAPSASTGVTKATPSNQTPSQTAFAVGTGTPSPTSSNPSPQLLGAIIGSILGLATIIMVVLLMFRWRRNKRQFAEAGHQRRASGIPSPEKDPMDFVDRGLNFGNHAHGYSHGAQESQGSFSSMAILMGNVGQGQKRGVLGRRNGSNGSDSSSTFNKKYKAAISKPIPQDNFGNSGTFNVVEKGTSSGRGALAPVPGPAQASGSAPTARPRGSGTARRGSTRRSSGWNRYWSGGSALNILGFGSKRQAEYEYGSDRGSGSQYSDAGLPTTTTQVSQVSAMPPPLSLARPASRMSRVASNSPTIGHASDGFPLKEGMAGQIERPGSSSTVSSYNDRRDTMSTGVPTSIHQDTWTPVGGLDWNRESELPNLKYADSDYTTILPRGKPTDSSSRAAPSGHRAVPQHSSDMSWLNLGVGEQR